jgi:hypothetical protein
MTEAARRAPHACVARRAVRSRTRECARSLAWRAPSPAPPCGPILDKRISNVEGLAGWGTEGQCGNEEDEKDAHDECERRQVSRLCRLHDVHPQQS